VESSVGKSFPHNRQDLPSLLWEYFLPFFSQTLLKLIDTFFKELNIQNRLPKLSPERYEKAVC